MGKGRHAGGDTEDLEAHRDSRLSDDSASRGFPASLLCMKRAQRCSESATHFKLRYAWMTSICGNQRLTRSTLKGTFNFPINFYDSRSQYKDCGVPYGSA